MPSSSRSPVKPRAWHCKICGLRFRAEPDPALSETLKDGSYCQRASCPNCRVPSESGYNKHHNKKTVVDGMTFDSGWEAEYHGMLMLQQRAGLIRDLERQVVFDLLWPGGELICRYKADFQYVDVEAGLRRVVDAKGAKKNTAEFNLKKRLMKLCYGIDVEEVRRPERPKRSRRR